MSKIDYGFEDAPASKKSSGSKIPPIDIWDALSVVMLLITLCSCLYFTAIFISPNASYNLLPPKPKVDIFALPTFTITPIQLAATWTSTPLPDVTETSTFLPTFTLEPSPTSFSLIPPTKTPTPTKTPKAPFSGSFKGIDSTIIHPELGCNWQGIGGTVVDANNADLVSMIIVLTGFYNGKSITMQTASGAVSAYGRSGFEFFLGTLPLASKGELSLQLLDQSIPLSGVVQVDTFTDCSKNLILVRFVKNP
jgi:hypothetical protein